MSKGTETAETPEPGGQPAEPHGQSPALDRNAPADTWPDDREGREPGDLSSALSPRQIIGGFALLAGLILVLRRRRRKG